MPCDPEIAGTYHLPDIFTCKQCGDCCRGYGGTYVTGADIEAISAYIGMDPERFTETYCTLSGERPLLVQQKNGFCIFWKDKVCTIHPVKPTMCKEWPFIRSVLVDPANWEKMASMCPGIRKGTPPGVVQECVRAMRRWNNQ